MFTHGKNIFCGCTKNVLPILLTVALLLLCNTAVQAVDVCNGLPTPTIKFERIQSPVVFHTNYDARNLTQIGANLKNIERQVLGLTLSQARVRITSNTEVVADAAGGECASPQLVVNVGYAPVSVYVAREFAQGSCAYKFIYEHEMKHVYAYLSHLDVVEREVLQSLTARFVTIGPLRGAKGQIEPMLMREINEKWLPEIQRRLARVQELQAHIDSSDEYNRVGTACNGEMNIQI